MLRGGGTGGGPGGPGGGEIGGLGGLGDIGGLGGLGGIGGRCCCCGILHLVLHLVLNAGRCHGQRLLQLPLALFLSRYVPGGAPQVLRKEGVGLSGGAGVLGGGGRSEGGEEEEVEVGATEGGELGEEVGSGWSGSGRSGRVRRGRGSGEEGRGGGGGEGGGGGGVRHCGSAARNAGEEAAL